MATVNLAVRFLVELAGVVALAVWGLHATADPVVAVVVAAAAAAALIVVWAVVVAPRARNRLPQQARDLVGTALLLVAALALAAAGDASVAAVFAAVVVLNQVLLIVLPAGQPSLARARIANESRPSH